MCWSRDCIRQCLCILVQRTRTLLCIGTQIHRNCRRTFAWLNTLRLPQERLSHRPCIHSRWRMRRKHHRPTRYLRYARTQRCTYTRTPHRGCRTWSTSGRTRSRRPRQQRWQRTRRCQSSRAHRRHCTLRCNRIGTSRRFLCNLLSCCTLVLQHCIPQCLRNCHRFCLHAESRRCKCIRSHQACLNIPR